MEPLDRKSRFEHRRARLAELLNALEPAPRAWFATAIRRSESYVARLLLPAGAQHRKNIGDAIMNAATSVLRLDPGWFDLPIGSAIPEGVRLDEKGRAFFERPPATRPNALGRTAGSVTNVTQIPEPFDQALFDALTPEQQQDIAQVAAFLTDVLARYSSPPKRERRAWNSDHEPIEKQITRGTRTPRPPKKKAG